MRAIVLFLILSGTLVSAQNSIKKVDQVINSYYRADESGGVVLLAKGNEIIYHRPMGLASKELKVPMRVDNTFRIASMTKQFVAVSVLILEEQGKLNLTDDIRKYLPDFPDKGREIQIRHLLSHTSGIRNLTSIDGYPEYMKKAVTPEELIAYFRNEPLEFVPGSQMAYSNSGYILLHRIIEKVSGMTLNDFMQRNIFSKIGVTTAVVEEDNQIIPDKASGYINERMTADYMSMTQIACLVMSAGDMYKWHTGLREGKLISAKHLKMAQSAFTLDQGGSTDYGFGWEIKVMNGDTLIQHGGGISGFGGYEMYLPRQNIFAVLLDNSQSRPEDLILYKAISAISDRPLMPEEIALTASQKKAIIGTYAFGKIQTRVVEKEGRLYLNDRYNNSSWPMRFTSANTFYIEEQYPFEYTLLEKNNEIVGINVKGRGAYHETGVKVN